jgi:hypothetical protein
MTDSWRQSEQAMRLVIAKEIWLFQEADKSFGDFDAVNDDDFGMAALAKRLCIDEAERIRRVVLASAVFRAAFASTDSGAARE